MAHFLLAKYSWIDALIGVMIGGVISMGLGLINHAIF